MTYLGHIMLFSGYLQLLKVILKQYKSPIILCILTFPFIPTQTKLWLKELGISPSLIFLTLVPLDKHFFFLVLLTFKIYMWWIHFDVWQS